MVPCPVAKSETSFCDAVESSGSRLAYTTPSNQFPLGLVMAKEVRYRLIEWAERNRSFIIEDDYCYELNHRNKPQPALQTLDNHGRVVYMGTFSKSLSPALRVNYLILPPDLLDMWRSSFNDAYPAVNWLTQEVLARYLNTDHYNRHIRRIQLRNRRKYDALKSALVRFMGNKIDVIEGGAGLHMLVNVKDGRPQAELVMLAQEAGVQVYGTDKYWIENPHPLASCILIGFSAISEDDIVPGIRALADAWFGN